MPQPKLISPISRQSTQKKRVAAYCRVSSNSADQLNSYARQIKVYSKKIQEKTGWELVEIFADEGISGTRSENRPEFQRMIRMCELRQIDIVITKSISRFARNVKEALEYVRKLKLLGVAVIFEKEGINTMSLGDEMLLNTFSAIAQEESQSISQNMRHSIVKRMEMGEYVDSNAPYGYRLVEKKLQPYESEAMIVRSIFHMYLDGRSTKEIAHQLNVAGVPTKLGGELWRHHRVSFILRNEKYVGDSLYQKTCREVTVPFRQARNRGQEDMYYAQNTHEGIIDRDTFERVQTLHKKRIAHIDTSGGQQIYPLTSRIRCVECGSVFRRKATSVGTKWVCKKHEDDCTACDSAYYTEERIYDGIISIINKLRFCEENIIGQVENKLQRAVWLHKQNNRQAREISGSIAELQNKLLMLDHLYSKNYLAVEVYQTQSREIRSQISALKLEREDTFESKLLDMLSRVHKLNELLSEIEDPLESFDEKLFIEIVEGITINNRDELTITLLGGLKFTEEI